VKQLIKNKLFQLNDDTRTQRLLDIYTATQYWNTMTEDTPLSILVEGVHVTCTVIKALILSIFRFFVPANRKSVQGEIVLVTGSGGAIGSRICTEFSRLGATLVLWDINERANEQTAEKIRTSGGKCFTYTVDVGYVIYVIFILVQHCHLVRQALLICLFLTSLLSTLFKVLSTEFKVTFSYFF
jgi:hypothetical protein